MFIPSIQRLGILKVATGPDLFKGLNLPTVSPIPSPSPSPQPDIADNLYNSLSYAETGGEANPWIRTKVRPPTGSSAYGPAQVTKRLVDDYTSRRAKEFTPQQLAYADDFSNQGSKFLQYGNEPTKEGYNPIYDYGGAGTLTTDADKAGYKDLTKQLMRMQWEDSGQDLDTFLKRWRGTTPEASYRQRFMSKYQPPVAAQ